MAIGSTILGGAGAAARRVEGSSQHDLVCRVGYAAHGFVYLLVGVLAVDAAIGSGTDAAPGEREVILWLGRGAFGTILLTLLGLGLIAYSYMRLWQGAADPQGHGNDAKGIGTRVGRLASGLTAAGLALYALSLAYGWFAIEPLRGAGGDRGTADLTARVMSWPGGRWMVGAIGAGVCAGGIAQLARAVKASFVRELAITAQQERWVRPLGRAAYGARFIVFLIVGGFLIAAAYWAEPGRARGLGGALRALQAQAYGPWLLGLTGAGLVAFAVLRGVYARYAVLPGGGRAGAGRQGP